MEEFGDKWCSILEDHLQCMVCLEIPTTSVLQCAIGHHTCSSCKMKLNVCPLCNSLFTQTRNFLAESLCSELNKMKLHSLELKVQKLSIKTVSVYTQTDLDVHKTTDVKETEVDIDGDKLQMYRKWKDMAPLVTKTTYSCLICPCAVKLSYERLIGHIKHCHGDIFYEEEENISSRIWKVDHKIPCNYYFAFHIKKMGLFILNINVKVDGGLCIIVKIMNSLEASKMFNYKFTIGSKRCELNYSQKVKSCLLTTTIRDYLFIQRDSLCEIADETPFDCRLTMRRVIFNNCGNIKTRKLHPPRYY